MSLIENKIDLTFMTIPQMTSDIGRLRIFQNQNCRVGPGEFKTCLKRDKLIEGTLNACPETKKEELLHYWKPRLGTE